MVEILLMCARGREFSGTLRGAAACGTWFEGMPGKSDPRMTSFFFQTAQ
jgi:hypothetical protein